MNSVDKPKKKYNCNACKDTGIEGGPDNKKAGMIKAKPCPRCTGNKKKKLVLGEKEQE